MSFRVETQSIYRREPLWIRNEFDDGTESSINKDSMEVIPRSGIYGMVGNSIQSFTDGDFQEMQSTINNVTRWTLKSNLHGIVNLVLRNNSKYSDRLLEVIFDYCMTGPGEMEYKINNTLVERETGPLMWKSSLPHRSLGQFDVRLQYRNLGMSDPKPSFEVDNFCVYPYKKILCDFVNYTPPTTTTEPTEIEVVRGYNSYQTTCMTNTKIVTALRFESFEEYNDFILNTEVPHVIIDEHNIYYRGVVKLGNVRKFGKDIYTQDIELLSPYKLGKGWI